MVDEALISKVRKRIQELHIHFFTLMPKQINYSFFNIHCNIKGDTENEDCFRRIRWDPSNGFYFIYQSENGQDCKHISTLNAEELALFCEHIPSLERILKEKIREASQKDKFIETSLNQFLEKYQLE